MIPLRAELVIGSLIVSTDGHRQECAVLNPADQEVVGYAPVADAQLVDQAVIAAAEAFPTWSKLPAPRRAHHLSAIASWIKSNAPSLPRSLTLEQGKPLSEAASEVEAAAKTFDYYAAEAVRRDRPPPR